MTDSHQSCFCPSIVNRHDRAKLHVCPRRSLTQKTFVGLAESCLDVLNLAELPSRIIGNCCLQFVNVSTEVVAQDAFDVDPHLGR